jgi:uncharacterized membrane protein
MFGFDGMHDAFWPNIWGYWWLIMIFWWCGGARLLGIASHRLRRVRREDPALATLRERFARGEIDRAEYEERRAVLRGRPQAMTATTSKGDGPAWPDLP